MAMIAPARPAVRPRPVASQCDGQQDQQRDQHAAQRRIDKGEGLGRWFGHPGSSAADLAAR
jgi:hypothetical protein